MEKVDQNTFTGIYNTYYKKSFYFAKSYVHEDPIAEDIASEALIKLWELLKTKPVDNVGYLLLTILKNKALDHLKHEEIKRSVLQNMEDWGHVELSIRLSSLEECDPNEIFSNEVERIVHETLQQLSPQTRQIFVKSRFKGLSNNEIADEMHLSAKSVEYHITKALKAMKVALKDYLPVFLFLLS